MSQHTDDVLDDIDAALDDYVEWHGSTDSASWAADGSHEVATSGEYYGWDRAGGDSHVWEIRVSDEASDWAALWTEINPRFPYAQDAIDAIEQASQRFWTEAAARARATLDELFVRSIVTSSQRSGRTLEMVIVDEMVRLGLREPQPEPPADPLAAIAAEGLRLAEAGEQPRHDTFTAALEARLEAEGAAAAADTTRRHLRAWESPYGPRRAGRAR